MSFNNVIIERLLFFLYVRARADPDMASLSRPALETGAAREGLLQVVTGDRLPSGLGAVAVCGFGPGRADLRRPSPAECAGFSVRRVTKT